MPQNTQTLMACFCVPCFPARICMGICPFSEPTGNAVPSESTVIHRCDSIPVTHFWLNCPWKPHPSICRSCFPSKAPCDRRINVFSIIHYTYTFTNSLFKRVLILPSPFTLLFIRHQNVFRPAFGLSLNSSSSYIASVVVDKHA